MKKFINRPDAVVEEMLEGLVALCPGSSRLAGHKAMIRADAEHVRDLQVAVISGGGSGHEPAHAGYIGAGMLSAAVLGEVFTSPSSDAVLAAIKAVAGRPGALLVVKNYTGDRLNFGLAAEMARAEGLAVEMVIVDDDVALLGAEQATGARGLAGTVFIHKIVGAAAAEGLSLKEVAAAGRSAVASLATMGVSFSAGTSPATGKPSFELGANEMELGLGIHGEPGVRRTEIQPADELTETLLKAILNDGKFGGKCGDERQAAPDPQVAFAPRVALMINNLGATTEMELAIVARRAVPFLESRGLAVERVYAGTFLSSLDMAGLSLSVLGVDEERVRRLDAATDAPAWPNAARKRPGRPEAKMRVEARSDEGGRSGTGLSLSGQRVGQAIEAACRAMIAAEPELTEMDRVVGDGDLGSSMERGAKGVEARLGSYPLDDLAGTLKAVGHTVRQELGGSSGPLYGVLFLRCGTVLAGLKSAGIADWAEALGQGGQAISDLGGAKPGDRTMLDALDPFVKTLTALAESKPPMEALLAAVEAAEKGAAATSRMKPRLGRSSYLGDRALGHPDPGAKAVAMMLRAVYESLRGRAAADFPGL